MITPEKLNQRGVGYLPGHLGIVFTGFGPREMRAELQVTHRESGRT